MIKLLLILSLLFFSTVAYTGEKRVSKSELLEIEYNKRIKKSCVRINDINNYYLSQLDDIKLDDTEIKRLIKLQMVGTRTFLFKYKCHKFGLNKYKLT